MSRTSRSVGNVPTGKRTGAIRRCVNELIATAADHDQSDALREALAELQQCVSQLREVIRESPSGAVPHASNSAPDDAKATSQSDSLLEAILEGTPFAMLLLDGDRRVRQVNRAGEALAGGSPDEVLASRAGAALRCLGALDDPRGCGFGTDCEHCVLNKTVSDTVANRQAHVGVRVALSLSRQSGSEEVQFRFSSTPVEFAGESMALVCLEDITDRERAEEVLRISEERYRTAQAMGRVGHWEYDLQTAEFWGSDEAKRIYGFDPQANHFSIDAVETCIPEREWVHQALVDLIEKDKPYNLQFEIKPRNSSKSTIISSVAELHRDAHGSPLKVVGVIQDITERKLAEEVRQAHLRFFERVDRVNRAIQGTDDLEQMMSDVLDVVLEIFDCDRAALVYPCGPEEAAWRAPMERARPEYPGVLVLNLEVPFDPDVVRVHKQVLESDDPVGFGPGNEHALPPDVAEQFNLQSQLAMAVRPKGAKPYMFVIHQCSRPRTWTPEEGRLLKEIGRRLEDGLTSLSVLRNLRQGEAKLKKAQRIAKLGNWEWNVVENTLWWSDEVFRIFCIPPEQFEATYEAFIKAVHPDDRERVETSVRQALLHESVEWRIDYRVACADGSVRFVHEEAETVFDPEGRPLRRVGTVQDITERKLAEEERQTNLRFFECMDQVNRAIQGASDPEQMMRDVLDVVLTTMDCDRAYILDPCDPDASSWRVTIEHTRPEYPGASALGRDIPMTPDIARALNAVRSSSCPVQYGPESGEPIPEMAAKQFGVLGQLAMAIHPTGREPYMFGLHQCSRPRVWTPEEVRLFEAICQRMSDALTILLSHRELRESERRFRAVVEQAADAFYLTDKDGAIKDVNHSACDSLGFSRNELLAMNIADVDVAIEDHAHTIQLWKDVCSGRIETLEGRHRRKDGSTFPVEVRLRTLELDDEPLLLGLARDITDRKRAEDTLRAKERELRTLLDNIPDCIARFDTDGQHIYVNPAVQKAFGVTSASLSGKALCELDGPGDSAHHAVLAGLVRRAFDEGASNSIEAEWRTTAGVRVFDVLHVPEKDELGNVISVLGIAHDVTERKRAEELLLLREREFRALAENSPDNIARYDVNGRLVYANPTLEKTLERPASEMVGKTPLEARRFDEFREYQERIDGVLATGEETEMDTVVPDRGDGARNYNIRFVAERDERGEVVGVLAIGRDITERKQAEEEKQRLTAQLHQAQKMQAIGQLAGGVAHDFNNLLTVIVGNVELIEPTLAENAAVKRSLADIMEATRQASGVTRSLLTFSRRVPIEKERVELRKLVQKTLHLLRRIIPATISFATDPPDQPPVWLYADRTQLQQIIMNLAVNSRDAMPDGGTLRVAVAELDGEADKAALSDAEAAELATGRVAQLIVSDTGAGMSPEVRDRVFEPFFTTKAREQGTGLGLAIVHGVLNGHGGAIEIDSALGEGTTFTISLPIMEADGVESAEEQALGEDRTQGELVLVAEDNWNVRSIITTALNNSGLEVLEAVDGAALTELFAERLGDIRLLVINVDLPKRSGPDCLREIRAKGAITPAIIVTGGIEFAAERDLDRYSVLLRKPFNTAKLQRLAIDLISGRHQLETKE